MLDNYDVLHLSLDEIIRRNRHKYSWRRPRPRSTYYGRKIEVKRLSNGYRYNAPLQPRYSIPKRGWMNRQIYERPRNYDYFQHRGYAARALYNQGFFKSYPERRYDRRSSYRRYPRYDDVRLSRVSGSRYPKLKPRSDEYGIPYHINRSTVVQGLRSDHLESARKLDSSRYERSRPVRDEEDYDDYNYYNISSRNIREKARKKESLSHRPFISYAREMLSSHMRERSRPSRREKNLRRRRPPSPVVSISSDSSNNSDHELVEVYSQPHLPKIRSRIEPSKRIHHRVPSRTLQREYEGPEPPPPAPPPPPLAPVRDIRIYAEPQYNRLVEERAAPPLQHRQILNPQIQKEIAALQGKTISSGNETPIKTNGVKNFRMLPNVTSLRLHRRFTCRDQIILDT